ncbi:Cytochrome OXidase assembly protein [Ditylenchus destructor]|uniref:Cytochrome OXidase assembly protein n=1 Tax=Ditylenchus destructor TaxID=166010 RepID=A0AAD4NLP7_9BILA|nr:Cytochrome OXidase assembly protein [Ditylenchus destructor]
MRLSRILAISFREDRRPFYRKILTNYRLDNAYLTTIYALQGITLWLVSFAVTNGVLYYGHLRGRRRKELEVIEREIIEADLAGFKVKD